MKYVREGYSFFQNWLANQLLRNVTGDENATIVMLTAPMKSEPLVNDGFHFFMVNLFPLCLVLVYMLPILRLTSRIVHEKVFLNTY